MFESCSPAGNIVPVQVLPLDTCPFSFPVFTPLDNKKNNSGPSPNNPLKLLPLHPSALHRLLHPPPEPFPPSLQILGRDLVQRIGRIRLQKQKLQPHNHGVQVQHGLPVLAQDVQADVALEVDVRVVNLLPALDLGRVVREVLVDGEGKVKGAALVHALVGLDCEGEVEDVVRVREGGFHGGAEGELGEVWYIQTNHRHC